jgi:hypothetical protein
MANFDPTIYQAASGFPILICNLGNELREIGARFLEVLDIVRVWRGFPNETQVCTLEWGVQFALLVELSPVRFGAKEPVVSPYGSRCGLQTKDGGTSSYGCATETFNSPT